jgi:four helix bundle protein
MRRAAISVPSNIAEGAARNTTKEFINFLYISLGSLAELDTQLILATELGYFTANDEVQQNISSIKRMLCSLISKLKNKNNK